MRRVHRKKPLDYLLPFFILLGFGVIVVLGFKLWAGFSGSRGDVYFYLPEGKAKILQYGVKEWENAFSGTKLLVGDSLKTGINSRAVLQFYNGSYVRLGDDTEVTLTELSKRGDSEKIALSLDHGQMWVNKARSADVQDSRLEVRTSHMLIKDVGTVFEVEKMQVESVRVMKGNVLLDIFVGDNGSDRADSVEVGVGQEVNLDSAVLKSFQNHENPSVLMALSDDFKATDWYRWNSLEDQNPTDFAKSIKVGGGVNESQVLTEQIDQSATMEVTPVIQNSQQVLHTQQVTNLTNDALKAPYDLTFNGGKNSVTTFGVVKVIGKVQGAAKVVVSGLTLSKFKSGDTTFTYYANENGGNLNPGLNEYEVYAIDANGKESARTKFTITYNKAPATTVKPALTQTQQVQP